jgi:hypothetical protein
MMLASRSSPPKVADMRCFGTPRRLLDRLAHQVGALLPEGAPLLQPCACAALASRSHAAQHMAAE